MGKKPSFGTMEIKKRNGVAPKNHFLFGEKPLKHMAFIDRNDSMCGVKAAINVQQASEGMIVCWTCGLYHKPRINAKAISEFSGVVKSSETLNV